MSPGDSIPMSSPTRPSSTLGRRSIVARIAAVIALAACGVAIYLLVTSFSKDESGGGPENDKKGRSEQTRDQKAPPAAAYTVAAGDTLSAIAVHTGIPASKIERLNPD